MIDFFVINKDIIVQIGLGLFLIISGFYVNRNSEKLEKNGIKTIGQVINYKEEYSFGENTTFPKKYYYAIILFTDLNGEKRQVIDDFGISNKPKNRLPYSREIYYIEENGEIIMSSYNNLKGVLGMVLLIIGLVLIIFTILDIMEIV